MQSKDQEETTNDAGGRRNHESRIAHCLLPSIGFMALTQVLVAFCFMNPSTRNCSGSIRGKRLASSTAFLGPKRLRQQNTTLVVDLVRAAENAQLNEDSATIISTNDELLHELNLEKEHACGWYKCFFYPKQLKKPEVQSTGEEEDNSRAADSLYDETHAFLVGEDRCRRSMRPDIPICSTFAAYSGAYQLATMLEEEFGIRHLLPSPPFRLSKFNQTQCNTINHPHTVGSNPNFEYNGEFNTVVQRVRTIASPHIELRIGDHEAEKQNIRTIMRESKDPDLFLRNLSHDLKVARQIFQEYPEFVEDFQVFVDARGRVFHTDMDRPFFVYPWSKGYNDKDGIVTFNYTKTIEHVHSIMDAWEEEAQRQVTLAATA